MKMQGTLAGDFSGSLGGITAAKARGGIQYIRARTTPTNPNTIRQQTARAAMTAASQAWKLTLTDSERNSWRAAAAGLEKSGIDLYTACNQPRGIAGLDQVLELDAPAVVEIGPVSLAGTAGALTATFDDTDGWCDVDGAGLMIFVTDAITDSAPSRYQYRYATTILGDSVSPPTSPQAGIQDPWGNGVTASLDRRAYGLVTTPEGYNYGVLIPSFQNT